MKTYIFHEGQIPAGYTPGFEESLFNRQSHRLLQSAKGWISFYILKQPDRSVAAAIHFHFADSVAGSPLRSPFGSIEFLDRLPNNVLLQFILFFEGRLKTLAAKTIIIKAPPEAYSEQQSKVLHTIFFNLNYKVIRAEIGSVIKINDPGLVSALHTSQKKRLRKAREAGLIFKRTEIKNITAIYSFIKQCRDEKKYRLSMSLEALRNSANKFPDRYFLFSVYHRNTIVAASIAILVRKDILYDFYHDHLKTFDHLSPIVLLVDGIYDFCLNNNIRLLDLGTSALENQPNFSLLTFKTRLGGKPTPKFTFEKQLD